MYLYYSFVQVNLDVKTIEQLRQEYASLAIDKCQSGLDDRCAIFLSFLRHTFSVINSRPHPLSRLL